LAITLLVYGVAEMCDAYGFVAVFVAALVVRQHEHGHAYHTTLHLFAEQCERLLMALLLVLFGGALVSGILVGFTLHEVAFALVLVLVVRPVAGWLSLLGSGLRQPERWAIAVFGVRGIGSFYYIAFALNHAAFERPETLWRVVSLVVLASIMLHGFSAKPALAWLDRRRPAQARRKRPGS
jgi:NhaP-type Na+/H+ or K+/H+ antiporter